MPFDPNLPAAGVCTAENGKPQRDDLTNQNRPLGSSGYYEGNVTSPRGVSAGNNGGGHNSPSWKGLAKHVTGLILVVLEITFF